MKAAARPAWRPGGRPGRGRARRAGRPRTGPERASQGRAAERGRGRGAGRAGAAWHRGRSGGGGAMGRGRAAADAGTGGPPAERRGRPFSPPSLPSGNVSRRPSPPPDSWGRRPPRGGQDARPIRPGMGPGREQAPRRPQDAGRPTGALAGAMGCRRPARGGRPELGDGGPPRDGPRGLGANRPPAGRRTRAGRPRASMTPIGVAGRTAAGGLCSGPVALGGHEVRPPKALEGPWTQPGLVATGMPESSRAGWSPSGPGVHLAGARAEDLGG
jgi:hypothetical protein